MATISANGIVGKSLNDYLADLQAEYLAIDPNWNIEADSPDGQLIGTQAELCANIDELVVAAYNSKDPDRAVFEELDAIGRINDLQRQAATFSIAPITITGVSATVIPAGSIIRNVLTGTRWLTSEEITLSGGTGGGFAVCETAGAQTAGVGQLTAIVTPIAGWQGVTNSTAATLGREQESDTAFRLRRANSVSIRGSNQIDNMYSAVANIEGVTNVKIYENDTGSADSNGLPANSISVVVNGGTSADIAAAIYSKKNPGCALFGDSAPVTVEVISEVTGNVKDIVFQRAIGIEIFVAIEIEPVGTLPGTIEEEIRQAIIDYAAGTLIAVADGGFNQGGFDIGDDVPAGRLYTPINKVLGKYGDSYVASLEIGLASESTGVTTLSIDYNEIATFLAENIEVTTL
jgi:uncharacterized phage protein gp47/JayE